jgi:Flp pilus assembly protein TadG
MRRLIQHSRVARQITGLSRLVRATRGVALIEFGFALPVVLVFVVGGMELTNYVIVQMQINRIAAMTADNASRLRTPMSESYMNQLFTGVDKAGANINFTQHGRVIVSSVQNNSNSTGQWIRWQRCWGNLNVNSKYGVQDTGKTNNALPTINGLTAQAGSALIYAEVYYDYQPIISHSFFGSSRITHETAFIVRQRTDFSISGSNPATC